MIIHSLNDPRYRINNDHCSGKIVQQGVLQGFALPQLRSQFFGHSQCLEAGVEHVEDQPGEQQAAAGASEQHKQDLAEIRSG